MTRHASTVNQEGKTKLWSGNHTAAQNRVCANQSSEEARTTYKQQGPTVMTWYIYLPSGVELFCDLPVHAIVLASK